jgi:hypothetical protein
LVEPIEGRNPGKQTREILVLLKTFIHISFRLYQPFNVEDKASRFFRKISDYLSDYVASNPT